jgi:hypothetical protein
MLISAQRDYFLDASVNRSVDNVFRSNDVRQYSLKRVVFAGGHLFQSGGMHNQINLIERSVKALLVSDVTNEISHHVCILPVGEHLLHFVLLQFISAEDNQLVWLMSIKNHFGEFLTKRSCTTGYQNVQIIKHWLLVLYYSL